jgi:L-seryl-tRNA(Ser) seleniumtransferase
MHKSLKQRPRRAIPSVARILESLGTTALPRPLVVDLIRRELSKLRAGGEIPDVESIVDLVRVAANRVHASRLQPVINGTGIIVHTNFGRAPLSEQAADSIRQIGASYTNLEFDVATGERSHRGEYLERALAVLCQAEAATVVNNCAAALVLITRHFVAPKLDGFKPSSSFRFLVIKFMRLALGTVRPSVRARRRCLKG